MKFTQILEYLTDAQRERYSSVDVSREPREATDHFFGVGNDMVREDLPDETPASKGEIQLAIERAIGQEISVEDYLRGTVKDRYNRDVKIGRLIKDEKLRNQFASDPARQGTRKSGYYATIHRGVEVAGQTNSAPDPTHPDGHSWGGQSCKNVDTGCNRHYLEHEIRAGTVVIFVHEQSGKEIYRATLHPYTNSRKKYAYALDAEYGVKNSVFTDYAKSVATRLSYSGKVKSISDHFYTVNSNVYVDRASRMIGNVAVLKNLNQRQIFNSIVHFQNNRNHTAIQQLVNHANIEPQTLSKILTTSKINDDVYSVILWAWRNKLTNYSDVEAFAKWVCSIKRLPLKRLFHPLLIQTSPSALTPYISHIAELEPEHAANVLEIFSYADQVDPETRAKLIRVIMSITPKLSSRRAQVSLFRAMRLLLRDAPNTEISADEFKEFVQQIIDSYSDHYSKIEAVYDMVYYEAVPIHVIADNFIQFCDRRALEQLISRIRIGEPGYDNAMLGAVARAASYINYNNLKTLSEKSKQRLLEPDKFPHVLTLCESEERLLQLIPNANVLELRSKILKTLEQIDRTDTTGGHHYMNIAAMCARSKILDTAQLIDILNWALREYQEFHAAELGSLFNAAARNKQQIRENKTLSDAFFGLLHVIAQHSFYRGLDVCSSLIQSWVSFTAPERKSIVRTLKHTYDDIHRANSDYFENELHAIREMLKKLRVSSKTVEENCVGGVASVAMPMGTLQRRIPGVGKKRKKKKQ